MGKTILFSPIGGTDPISQDNYKEGALLHICRFYKPDEIYLYMSKEIIENEKMDQRYSYCLKKLDEAQDRKTIYHWIERADLSDVHIFNYAFEEFKPIINEIVAQMNEDDVLLLNVSSGTPAMKSALLVIVTMIELNCKVIQVGTPNKAMNEHNHKGYLVKELWEMNEDNVPDCENRCEEVKCPALSLIKNEEIIKKHIQAYNYAAALSLAKSLPQMKTKNYLPLIEVAQYRYLLDFSGVDKMHLKEAEKFFPVKSGDNKKYFEYALNLEVKYKRGEYADFLRAISPLIADLFELILKCQFGININEFCRYDEKLKFRNWDSARLQNTTILDVLNTFFNGQFKFGPVYSSQLIVLIEHYASKAENKSTDLISLVNALRDVEQNLRNKVAHQIISVTDESIKKETGFTGKQIIDMIKKTFKFAGINISKEYWTSYDDMNNKILKAMECE